VLNYLQIVQSILDKKLTAILEEENRIEENVRHTVQSYFEGISKGGGWEALIADDMIFTMFSKKTSGREAYLAATNQFLQVATYVRVLQIIAEGNDACAITRYKLESPKGDVSESDIAEVFSVKDGKIKSNTIFFDTQAFNNFMASFSPPK
jgi:ketosteroid isomerase-like protein